MFRLIRLLASVVFTPGVKVAVQVMPPSALLTSVRVPLAIVRSSLARPVTASLKVMVTRLVSPARRAVSATTMVAVGRSVSSVTATDVAAPSLPFTSLALTLRVLRPSTR